MLDFVASEHPDIVPSATSDILLWKTNPLLLRPISPDHSQAHFLSQGVCVFKDYYQPSLAELGGCFKIANPNEMQVMIVLIDWLINALLAWFLYHQLIDWLVDWLIECMTGWFDLDMDIFGLLLIWFSLIGWLHNGLIDGCLGALFANASLWKTLLSRNSTPRNISLQFVLTTFALKYYSILFHTLPYNSLLFDTSAQYFGCMTLSRSHCRAGHLFCQWQRGSWRIHWNLHVATSWPKFLTIARAHLPSDPSHFSTHSERRAVGNIVSHRFLPSDVLHQSHLFDLQYTTHCTISELRIFNPPSLRSRQQFF